MNAVVVRQGEDRPSLIDIPTPEPEPGEALVRTLRVGIDGTDHEVLEKNYGGFPPDVDYQVLGHEAVGIVEEIRDDGGRTVSGGDASDCDLEAGDLVVPTVRRPPSDGINRYFERGEPDMAPPDRYVERGIVGAHGYMSEYFTSPPEFLVPVPEALEEYGFLVEPTSNVEKAVEHAVASRSAFTWDPESVLVLGNGPLGLLALALVQQDGRFERAYCLGRRNRPDPTIDVIERLGATYVDSRETPVPEVPDVHEPMDIVFEATGHARHAVETVDALAPGGVGVLAGIPEDWTFEVDGGRLHREFVLENKALVGSVNSHVRHFEAAIDTLRAVPEWLFDDLVTGVHPPEEVDAAFESDETTIKQVVEFDAR